MTDSEWRDLQIKKKVRGLLGNLRRSNFDDFLEPLPLEDGMSEYLETSLQDAIDKKCPLCKKRTLTLTNKMKATAELDHKIPKAQGGRSTKENLHFICHQCNLYKRDLSLDQWNEFQSLSEPTKKRIRSRMGYTPAWIKQRAKTAQTKPLDLAKFKAVGKEMRGK